ncbi:hypothetical protein AALB53_16345 [Lachnospiraceae bacterium 47-T17]
MGSIRNKQKYAFSTLINQRLPELISSKSTVIDDIYTVTFEALPMTMERAITEEGTYYIPVKTKCTVKNSITQETLSYSIDLLKLPVYQDLGFMIRGNYMQILDLYDRAPGWIFTKKNVPNKLPEVSAKALAVNGRTLHFIYDNKQIPLVNFKPKTSRGGENDKSAVTVSIFFRAITGYTEQELLDMFDSKNPYVLAAFSGVHRLSVGKKEIATPQSRNDCIEILADAMLGTKRSTELATVAMKLRDIRNYLFSENYLNLGSGNAAKLTYTQSFAYRANNKTLAKDVNTVRGVLKRGIILTQQELEVLDNSPINEIEVDYNGKIYLLQKFSNLTFRVLDYVLEEDVTECNLKKGQTLDIHDLTALNASNREKLCVKDPVTNKKTTVIRRVSASALQQDDIFTAFSIWMNNLNGYDTLSNQYELTNRKVVPYDIEVMNIVDNQMSAISEKLRTYLLLIDRSETMAQQIPDYSEIVNPDEFINKLRDQNNKVSQMSDMCNITSFISKNSKVTSNLGGQNITPDLVNVQDLQEGRLDAFDVPESSKIGIVHNRTILSSLDSNGSITAPYLVVKDGVVVSDKPVYLTATEESDKYIAEWNETFVNADGSKKKTVKASYNGNITSVATELVSYMQYSSLQTLSLSHAMVTFPGHSNGKRITMACNQVRQAVPCVNRVRPYSNACGESLLDAGFYYCRDITLEYYNDNVVAYPDLKKYNEVILNSDLQLTCINSSRGTRSLTFSVVEVKRLVAEEKVVADYTAVLSYPYLLKNSENAVFSYDINHKKDGLYKKDDVIAYSNSMSLENKEHVEFIDFGNQRIDEGTFDKGTALVQNLIVFYKTCASSTIDDACTVSKKLIGDDTLTSLSMFTVTETLRQFGNKHEEFAIFDSSAAYYFDYNGLPKVGTVLQPGDPVICKVIEKNGTRSAHYKYLDPYTYGQVVYTNIYMKKDEKVAEVCIAQRSYAKEGDKLTGRHGNKGVIARILPEEEMPYIPELGLTADIVLNPLGIPSRQNISQLLDAGFGICMMMDDKYGFVSPYVAGDLDFVKEQMQSHNVHPAIAVDGRTGLPFKRPVNYGVLGMYKLHHMAAKKAHAVGMDAPVDPVFLQPRKGAKMDGGQSIGEMELWSLLGVGVNKSVQELYSTQSDDCISKRELTRAYYNGRDSAFVNGNNNNELSMQACYRSMGIEFVTNGDMYEFKPVDDVLTKSLSMQPVTNDKELHSVAIFGLSSSPALKEEGRNKWGWLALNTKIINPIWIEKGSLHKLMYYCNAEGDTKSMPAQAFSKMINGTMYLYKDKDTAALKPLLVKQEDVESMRNGDESMKEALPFDFLEKMTTGMEALVWLLENYDVSRSLELSKEIVSSYKENHSEEQIEKSENYSDMLKKIRLTEDFINTGQKLTDYIITTFPVMPQTYRPVLEVSRNSVVDFDWHYKQILNAASAVAMDDNMQTELRLYEKIKSFIGLNSKDTGRKQKHQNLLNYFAGKDKQHSHGKIRSALQSKRIVNSGRATIAPAKDMTMTPMQIGVPVKMQIKIFEEPLIGYFRSKLDSCSDVNESTWKRILLKVAVGNRKAFKGLFDKYLSAHYHGTVDDALEEMYQWIVDFCEGNDELNLLPQVVYAGRQPSLHKYSIRAYHPKVIRDNVIRVHPLVCAGYNADFDGDQMWVAAVMSLEAQEESMQKLSAACDFINPKDSSVMMSHTQDIVLGCYCATMLENNGVVSTKALKDAYYYNDLELLDLDVFNGIIEFHDLVVYTHHTGNRYLSTAGRILFNARLFGGFTTNTFSNPLNLADVDVSKFKDLRYDALITSGRGGKDNIAYYNLKKICMELYVNAAEACLRDYQNIAVFGFKVSDIFSVSLSLEDLDIVKNKEKVLNDAAKIKTLLEDDFQNGLIFADDKRDAVYSLYNNNKDGVNKLVKDELLENLSRDNNIFIMMDSGARGNETQVMHMCGIIGNLQKTKTEDLEDPITGNYYDGLSAFEMHMSSYSTRTGVASTQNETRSAGYSTHQVVFMTSGVKIVEHDCKKDNWWFDILWADRIPEFDKLIPSQDWFINNLLGKVIDSSDEQALKVFDTDGVITDKSFMSVIMAGGFHSVRFSDGTSINIDIDWLLGRDVIGTDKNAMRLLRDLLKDGEITRDCIKVLQRHAVKSIETDIGVFSLRYKIDGSCRSLLLHREARSLPHLRRMLNFSSNEQLSVITEDTLNSIEQEGIDRVQARILLDCQSKHGICAHCFGLKYSNLQLPEVEEFVGIEAAQAIGEPAAQLTLSLINKGGVTGESVASGVQIFEGLLNGNVLTNDTTPAKIIPNNGYVRISELDKSISVCIEPDSKDCTLCQECMKRNKRKTCALTVNGLRANPACLVSERIDKNLLIPLDNEWVQSGEQLTIDPITANDARTYSMVDPNLINTVDDSTEPIYVLRKRQMAWLLNYYRTFVSNNIYINARHFEILARIQNNYVTILDSKYDAYKVGDVAEVNDVINISGIRYKMRVSKRDEVILRTSGAFTALSFEDLPSVAAKLVNSSYKSPVFYNNSLIGAISAGTNIITNTPKEFKQYILARASNKVLEGDKPEEVIRSIILNTSDNTESKKSLSELLEAGIGNEMSLNEDDLLREFENMLISGGTESMGSFTSETHSLTKKEFITTLDEPSSGIKDTVNSVDISTMNVFTDSGDNEEPHEDEENNYNTLDSGPIDEGSYSAEDFVNSMLDEDFTDEFDDFVDDDNDYNNLNEEEEVSEKSGYKEEYKPDEELSYVKGTMSQLNAF